MRARARRVFSPIMFIANAILVRAENEARGASLSNSDAISLLDKSVRSLSKMPYFKTSSSNVLPIRASACGGIAGSASIVSNSSSIDRCLRYIDIETAFHQRIRSALSHVTSCNRHTDCIYLWGRTIGDAVGEERVSARGCVGLFKSFIIAPVHLRFPITRFSDGVYENRYLFPRNTGNSRVAVAFKPAQRNQASFIYRSKRSAPT